MRIKTSVVPFIVFAGGLATLIRLVACGSSPPGRTAKALPAEIADRVAACNIADRVAACNIADQVAAYNVPDQVAAYKALLARLLASEHYQAGLVCREEPIKRSISRVAPGGGVVAPKGVVIDGSAGTLVEGMGGRFLSVRADRSAIYVSPTRTIGEAAPIDDYSPLDVASTTRSYEVRPGQLIPGIPGYVLHAIEDEHLELRMAHLYDNAWLAESLVDMHRLTGDRAYLDQAEKLLLVVVKHFIHEDGTARLNWAWFGGHRPSYRGMSQAILMHSLKRFLTVRRNNVLARSLARLAETFVHTTEGCNNHFTNSAMGVRIAEDLLGVTLEEPGRMRRELGTISRCTVEQQGRIPYVMRRSSQYPFSKDTYQSYDFMLLGKAVYFYYPCAAEDARAAFRPSLVATERICFHNRPPGPGDVFDAARVAEGLRYYGMACDMDVSAAMAPYVALAGQYRADDARPLPCVSSATAALHLISDVACHQAGVRPRPLGGRPGRDDSKPSLASQAGH